MEAPRLKAIQTPPPDRTMWLMLQVGQLWTSNLCGETDGQAFYPVWSRASRLSRGSAQRSSLVYFKHQEERSFTFEMIKKLKSFICLKVKYYNYNRQTGNTRITEEHLRLCWTTWV